MAQAQRFAQRELEHLLGTRRERDLPRGELLTSADDARDLGADALDRDAQRLKHPTGEPLLFAQQPEQDVLGADVVVLQDSRLLLGEDDHLASALCKSLEHPRSIPLHDLAWKEALRSSGHVYAQTPLRPRASVTLREQNETLRIFEAPATRAESAPGQRTSWMTLVK
jgi:hypothetical protein